MTGEPDPREVEAVARILYDNTEFGWDYNRGLAEKIIAALRPFRDAEQAERIASFIEAALTDADRGRAAAISAGVRRDA